MLRLIAAFLLGMLGDSSELERALEYLFSLESVTVANYKYLPTVTLK